MGSSCSMMDGIEFQLRNPHHEVFTDLNTGRPGLSFPLPMDEKLAQGDAFRKSREKLKAELEEIDRYFSSPEAGCHTGPLNCSVCDQKKGKLIRAFCDYYLSTEPGTWTLDYPHFREHLQLRLNEPDPSLEAVHSIFTARLRHHLKNEHCTPHVSDLPSTTTMKRILLNMFMEGEPIPSILNFYLSDLEGRVSETEAAQFVAAMQKTKTPEDRARLYVLYYCSNGPNDPPVLRDFKEKYTRIFEALVPHDEVLVAMRKEAQDYQAKNVQHVQQLEERLGALELGKKAHLKKEQRKNARNGGDVTEQVVNCSLDGCPIEINLMTEEVIECVICEWMAEKGGMDGERRERAVYCSVEHAEDDFETHEHNAHGCSMRDRCIYYPAIGPPQSSVLDAACGLCNNCLSHRYISYFCSTECYEHNLDLHRDDFMQRDIGIHNHDDALEIFRPTKDMEILELVREEQYHDIHDHDPDADELEEGERMDDS